MMAFCWFPTFWNTQQKRIQWEIQKITFWTLHLVFNFISKYILVEIWENMRIRKRIKILYNLNLFTHNTPSLSFLCISFLETVFIKMIVLHSILLNLGTVWCSIKIITYISSHIIKTFKLMKTFYLFNS